jgi:hypothetical protein
VSVVLVRRLCCRIKGNIHIFDLISLETLKNKKNVGEERSMNLKTNAYTALETAHGKTKSM